VFSMLPPSSPTYGTGHKAHPSFALSDRHTWTVLVFIVPMTLFILILIQTTRQRNYTAPDALALRLVGDETSYEGLTYTLLQGSFFQSPGRVPVSPLFIAATCYALDERSPTKLLYIQAFVGVAVVPLIYLLARRLTGIVPALVAAGIVALDDLLIDHTRQIYTEILYTPLLLVVLLVLLWALQAPRPARFAWAGTSMAVLTLCRPTTALFPLLLPLLLPRG
jgi:hypothetical protein